MRPRLDKSLLAVAMALSFGAPAQMDLSAPTTRRPWRGRVRRDKSRRPVEAQDAMKKKRRAAAKFASRSRMLCAGGPK